MRLLAPDKLAVIMKQFFQDVSYMSNIGVLVLEEVSTDIIDGSLNLIVKHHLSINDAIHLQTAITNKNVIDTFFVQTNDFVMQQKQRVLQYLIPKKVRFEATFIFPVKLVL